MRVFLAIVAILTGHTTIAFFLLLWKVMDS
jgi:hypothetical protein